MRPTPLLTVLLTLAPLAAQIPLQELPKLARARADRLRPKQIAALEPFWPDLSLEYRSNQEYLDQRIAEAASLGDSVVPLLLEKLQPAQYSEKAHALAANCRRVLEKLDPTSFVDALSELALGKHAIARTQAILLLGHADTPQSVRVLVSLLENADADDRRLAVRSLRLIGARTPAAVVAQLLGSKDPSMRAEVLAYLTAVHADDVADTVVAALTTEGSDRLLPAYILYFGSCVTQHQTATEALLPLLDRERIHWLDTRNLVRALSTVAPKGHDATLRALHAMIDDNEIGSLAVEAAVSLRALGDKQGVTRLKRTLDDKLRRRRQDAALYEQRAHLLFAIGDYDDAVDDYEKIIENTEGAAMTRRAYRGILFAEARRERMQALVKAMKESGMDLTELLALAAEDEPLQQALEHPRVASYLKSLQR